MQLDLIFGLIKHNLRFKITRGLIGTSDELLVEGRKIEDDILKTVRNGKSKLNLKRNPNDQDAPFAASRVTQRKSVGKRRQSLEMKNL